MILQNPPSVSLAIIISFVIGATVHEFAHAYSAWKLGDDTAYRQGRVTLNPLVQMNPFGFLMLLVAGFGWAGPTPVSPWKLRPNPRIGNLIVTFAGPASGLLISIAAAFIVRIGTTLRVPALYPYSPDLIRNLIPSPGQFLFWFVYLNVLLFFFNLLPIYPFDGYWIVLSLLPPELAIQWEELKQYGMFVILGIFALSYVGIDLIGWIIQPPVRWTVGLLLGI